MEKHQILDAGGEFEESGAEPIESWLEFLTDLGNLRLGLPNLIVYFGSHRLNYLKVTFDSNYTSLRSLILEMNLMSDNFAITIFQKTDFVLREMIHTDAASELANTDCLKGLIFKLFQHSELEELKMPFKVYKLPDRFDKLIKLKSADLYDSHLIELPPSFYQLPALENLNVCETLIKELPTALANLPLRTLSFRQSCSAELLGSLVGLIKLECYRNNFIVPDEIIHLNQLKSLYLASVSHASENLLNLDKLEKLSFMSSTPTFKFHNITGKFPNLKELQINRAEVFADMLGNFKNLEKLTIEGNANESTILQLEESLKQLVNLKFLWLKGIGFTNLEWCALLVNLEYLGIENNAIETIPLSLGNLQKLETIILKKNPITSFPELPVMPQVTFIDLIGTKIIDKNGLTDLHPIPEELNKLKRIFPNVEYLSMM